MQIFDPFLVAKRRVSQIRAPLAACHEPARIYNKLHEVLYVFEHKTQYLLIHASCTHIVVTCALHRFHRVKFVYNTLMFYRAAIFVKNCSTWVSRLL